MRLIDVKAIPMIFNSETVLLRQIEIVVDEAARPFTVMADCGGFSRIAEFSPNSGPYFMRIPEPDREVEAEFTLKDGETITSVEAVIKPCKRWEIHFVPLCHHDYGYTKAAEPLLDDYIAYYRDVLRFIEATDTYPDDAKYRYTCEQMWSVSHFLKNCTTEERERFIRYAREGRIEISAFWGNIAEAHCSNEEIIRMMYPAFKLKRKYGIPIHGGSFVDITGQGWGIPKIMAGAGLEYFYNGMPSYFHWDDICGVHGAPVVHSYWDEDKVLRHGKPDAYWWEGQDGSRILTYYQGSYGWFHGWLTTGKETDEPESLEDIEAHLPGILEDMEKRGVPFNALRYIDHGVDNRAPEMMISNIVKAWNEKYDTPKLRVSTNAEFMRRFGETCGELPVYRGEIPHTEFCYATMSFAKETGLNFRNHASVAAAEFLASAARMCGLDGTPQAELAAIYEDILMFDEHCYGMADPYGADYDYNWSTKAHHAYRAAAKSKEIITRSAHTLASMIHRAGDEKHIIVFNQLGFARSDIVRVSGLPLNLQCLRVVDCETGADVPYTAFEYDRHDLSDSMASELYTLHRMGGPEAYRARELVFTVKDVPPMGWRTYRLDSGEQAGVAVRMPENTLENRFYRVEFSQTGEIVSVFDKELVAELVDRSERHPFGGVICRNCHTQEQFLPEYLGFEVIHNSAVMQTALIKFRVKGSPEGILSVTLYGEIKRIDFELKLLFNGLPIHELFLALPVDIDYPQFEYEGAQCRPTPFRDQFPGSNSNYYCVQSWASAANSRLKAAVSSIEAHSLDFGGMWPSYVSQAHHAVHPMGFGKAYVTDNEIEKGHMYLLLAYNNIRTNFRMTQNGEVCYRFSLTTGAPDMSPTEFGWGFTNKLITAYSENGNGVLHPVCSLVRTDAANVRVLTVKQAEDGDGMILRLMETEGEAALPRVTLPGLRIIQVLETSLTEENRSEVPVEKDGFMVEIKPYEIRTFRVLLPEDGENG